MFNSKLISNLKSLKMKTALILILLVIGGFAATNSAQQLTLDTSKSSIKWTGKKVVGEHYGKINFISGSLTQNGDAYSGGEFIVDMKSLTVDDIKNEGTNAQLVGHLKSDDFFGVETYPQSKLVITRGVKSSGNEYDFTGRLTIKDQTHPVSFKAVLSGNTFTGKLVVDRTKFNVRYGSGSFFSNLGDNMIHDDFELDFNVVFNN
jgi:polyisoprenoid-binding protein YceI